MLAIHQQSATAVNPLSGRDWENALSAIPGASFFHSTIWAQILTGTYGFTPYYLRSGEDGSASLLSIMEANSFISGRRGVALPFTDECDPLVADSEKFSILWGTALGRAAARKWKYLEIRGGTTSIPTT